MTVKKFENKIKDLKDLANFKNNLDLEENPQNSTMIDIDNEDVDNKNDQDFKNLDAYIRHRNREKSLKTKEEVNDLVDGILDFQRKKHKREKYSGDNALLGKKFDKNVNVWEEEARKNIDKKIEQSVDEVNRDFNKKNEDILRSKGKKLLKEIDIHKKNLKNLYSLRDKGVISGDHVNIGRTEDDLNKAREGLKEIEKNIDLTDEDRILTERGKKAFDYVNNINKQTENINIPNEEDIPDHGLVKERLENSVNDKLNVIQEDIDSNKRNIEYLIDKDGEDHENVIKEKEKLRKNEEKLKEINDWENFNEEDLYLHREKVEKVKSNIEKASRKVEEALGEVDLNKDKTRSDDEVKDMKKSLLGFRRFFKRKKRENESNDSKSEKKLDIKLDDDNDKNSGKSVVNKEILEVEVKKDEVYYENLKKELDFIERRRLLIGKLIDKVESVEVNL